MRFQVQTFRAPRWLGPVLVLIAMALLPFALMLGLAVMALVSGASVLRLLLPPVGKWAMQGRQDSTSGRSIIEPGSPAIDAEYEVKDDHEKGN